MLDMASKFSPYRCVCLRCKQLLCYLQADCSLLLGRCLCGICGVSLTLI
jgi:hypothetical protein